MAEVARREDREGLARRGDKVGILRARALRVAILKDWTGKVVITKI